MHLSWATHQFVFRSTVGHMLCTHMPFCAKYMTNHTVSWQTRSKWVAKLFWDDFLNRSMSGFVVTCLQICSVNFRLSWQAMNSSDTCCSPSWVRRQVDSTFNLQTFLRLLVYTWARTTQQDDAKSKRHQPRGGHAEMLLLLLLLICCHCG